MKNAILAIVSLAVLGCHAQYKTMLHARITPTNSVVVDIPDWAKSDVPPVSEDGTLDYNALTNKPSINGTTIEGSLTTEDLGITVGASDYNDLTNKPSINGVELSGDKTASDLELATPDEALLAIYYPEGNVTSLDQITTNGLTYTFNDATRTATLSNGINAKGDVVIPWKVVKDGVEYKVTAVGDNAFFDSEGGVGADISSVVAPITVTSIGSGASGYCGSLKSVSFPSVTRIGGGAFESCLALESVSLPSVTSIESGAFSSCSALKSVSFPSATSIMGYAFTFCSMLESVTLPLVTIIWEEAFSNCRSLKGVDFGITPRDAVPTFLYGAFYGVPTTCKFIIPLGMYDEWIATGGWKDLYAQGYQFMGYANAADVAKKRDKTDNIVAATELSAWSTVCNPPNDALQAILDEANPQPYYVADVGQFYIDTPPPFEGYVIMNGIDVGAADKTVLTNFLTYLSEDPDNPIPTIDVTFVRTVIAKEGESYVSPVYVTNTVKNATADHVKSNDLQLAISPTNPAFSNAVLSVGIGVDTNAVAAINAILDGGDDALPVGGATTVGVLLTALVAALAALKKKVMQKYPFVASAITDGILTLTPFSRNAYSGSETFTVLMGGDGTYLRDCVFVVTAGDTAPTISWGENFHPRTDAETDFACVAGGKNVYWISEYAPGEFAVAGWQVTEGGSEVAE